MAFDKKCASRLKWEGERRQIERRLPGAAIVGEEVRRPSGGSGGGG